MRLPEPLQFHRSGVVTQDGFDQRQPALAHGGGAEVSQSAFQGEHAAGVKVGNAGDVGAVVVGAGEHIKQVADGVDAEGCQAGLGFGVQAPDGGYGIVGVAGAGRRVWGDMGAAAQPNRRRGFRRHSCRGGEKRRVGRGGGGGFTLGFGPGCGVGLRGCRLRGCRLRGCKLGYGGWGRGGGGGPVKGCLPLGDPLTAPVGGQFPVGLVDEAGYLGRVGGQIGAEFAFPAGDEASDAAADCGVRETLAFLKGQDFAQGGAPLGFVFSGRAVIVLQRLWPECTGWAAGGTAAVPPILAVTLPVIPQ